jgi:DNA-binding transcriptional ArsR family regulator
MKIGTLIQALNHPIRRDIIERLKTGPSSAGDLAEKYDVSKPTMSTHFTALREANLISRERDGNTIYYHLNTTATDEAMISIVELLEAVGTTTADTLKIMQNRDKAKP